MPKVFFGNHRKDTSALHSSLKIVLFFRPHGLQDYFSQYHCWYCLFKVSLLENSELFLTPRQQLKDVSCRGKCSRCDVSERLCVKLSLWAVAHDISVTSVHAPRGILQGSFAQCTRVEEPRGCCCTQSRPSL